MCFRHCFPFPLGAEAGMGRQIRLATCKEFTDYVKYRLGGGWTARHEHVHFDYAVYRAHNRQKYRYAVLWNLWVEKIAFQVSPFQNGLWAESVAHGGYIGRHRAISERNQDVCMRAHVLDFLQIAAAAYSTFHKGHVHTFGKLFQVHEGAVDQFDEICQRQ